MAVASLVLGIASIVLPFLIGRFGIIGVVCGVIAILLGIQSRKDAETRAMGTAGMVCGIIGIVLYFLIIVFAMSCVACIGLSGLASMG